MFTVAIGCSPYDRQCHRAAIALLVVRLLSVVESRLNKVSTLHMLAIQRIATACCGPEGREGVEPFLDLFESPGLRSLLFR